MRTFIVLCTLVGLTTGALAQPAPKKEEPKKEEKKLPPRADTAIMKLEKAHIADINNRPKLEELWNAMVRLESWYFIWRPDDGDGHPRVVTTEGKNYVQCFTDRGQAEEMATSNGLDKSAVRAFPVAKAVKMLAEFAQDEIRESVWDDGRINNAMTMPLRNYPDIYTFFLKKKP